MFEFFVIVFTLIFDTKATVYVIDPGLQYRLEVVYIIRAGGRCWLYPKSLGAWHCLFQVLYNLLIKRYKIYIRNKTVQITYILRSERFAFDRVKIPGLRTLRVRSSENIFCVVLLFPSTHTQQIGP